MSVKKIIFLNQKGGVGKTTTAVNLGSALAQLGKKVLLVDLDSQGNLTSAVSADNRLPGTYEVIVGKCSAKEACQSTSVQNLYVMTANINMAGLNIELVDQEMREFFVKKTLDTLGSEWDYILADCPPSLGLVTINAMCWAQYVIIPMQCEYFAMEGLNLLMRTVSNIKKSLNPSLKVLGILFTMYSKRTKLANDVVEDISSYFSSLVFSTLIPRNVRIAEAPSHGLPINVYDMSSSGAKAYQKLAQEVVGRVAKSE
ncbi:ParA family protein [uncultured Sphaerochaeta sp.]|uniref:ParA family protein n=1 Tax=uncultured Sphaerochaeta sp. TaxID=886478 RepID=UPI002A0A4D66|nr:ParA family protein [uncultured Sphaerochaeta sp.]